MKVQPPPPLGSNFEAFIEAQVASGKYETSTDVIEDALGLLQAREGKLKQLSQALQEGLDSGEAIDFDMNEWLESKRAGPVREEAA